MSTHVQKVVDIYRGKVLNVFVETVFLPNGESKDREVIRHSGAAAMVPLLDSDRLVLIKQYRHAVDAFLWEIPAGTLEPGEAFLDCAQRELTEETGYQAGRMDLLTEILPAPGYTDERIQIFVASELTPARQSLDEDEVLEVRSVAFDEALAMIVNGDIQDAKTITGLLLLHMKGSAG